jgi:hypothetical protein
MDRHELGRIRFAGSEAEVLIETAPGDADRTGATCGPGGGNYRAVSAVSRRRRPGSRSGRLRGPPWSLRLETGPVSPGSGPADPRGGPSWHRGTDPGSSGWGRHQPAWAGQPGSSGWWRPDRIMADAITRVSPVPLANGSS